MMNAIDYEFGDILVSKQVDCIDCLMYASYAPETVDPDEVTLAEYQLDILCGILEDLDAMKGEVQ